MEKIRDTQVVPLTTETDSTACLSTSEVQNDSVRSESLRKKMRNTVKKKIVFSHKKTTHKTVPRIAKNCDQTVSVDNNAEKDNGQVVFFYNHPVDCNLLENEDNRSSVSDVVVYRSNPSKISQLVAVHKNFGLEKLSIMTAVEAKILQNSLN